MEYFNFTLYLVNKQLYLNVHKKVAQGRENRISVSLLMMKIPYKYN